MSGIRETVDGTGAEQPRLKIAQAERAAAEPELRDVPAYFPCDNCARPVSMRQARATLLLLAATLCADCLPF